MAALALFLLIGLAVTLDGNQVMKYIPVVFSIMLIFLLMFETAVLTATQNRVADWRNLAVKWENTATEQSYALKNLIAADERLKASSDRLLAACTRNGI